MVGYIATWKYGNSHQRCFVKKGVLRNFAKFTGKHLCQSFFFNKVAGLGSEKESLAQVFSYKVYKIPKNTFFTEHLRTTASRNKSFFSEKQMGIQFKRISHQIIKFVESFSRKGYHVYYNSIVTENI